MAKQLFFLLLSVVLIDFSQSFTYSVTNQSRNPTSLFGQAFVRCSSCQTCYAIDDDDIRGKGRRMECSVCSHSWYQSKDRVINVRDGYEMVPLPDYDLQRIATNIEEGKAPKFMGDAKLYVGNIRFTVHEDDIRTVFSKIGEVGEVSLVRDAEGNNRGFGFVTMRNAEDGERAINELDGSPLRGRNIAVRASTN